MDIPFPPEEPAEEPKYIDVLLDENSDGKKCFRALIKLIKRKAGEDHHLEGFKGDVPGENSTVEDLKLFLERNTEHGVVQEIFKRNTNMMAGRLDLLYPKIKGCPELKKWFDGMLDETVLQKLQSLEVAARA